ncbi:TPA: prohibitin family protein [Kluyvera intermedia]|uniref:Band 7 protein n=2 Tax=Enterobacteriaceae TaxID=543 RepID=A0AAC8TKF9_9ENTR|nr:prohibitin family protein [Phytobacter ursingii]HAT2206581.1 prohibitin family protein [Kluyvera intermedia]AKL10489.1 Band 7 protein [Phytobacter ursingii]HAT2517304.1 prohibitin family protein [Kluyvera intermedia]HAT2605305.1 prohibitin family protein [Kluyvera intermedia]HAT2611598.1 prohibitin family protein [Kluyvera intermedia]
MKIPSLISPHKMASFAALGLIVLVLLFLSYYTVNEGERGILLRYGKIVKVAEPGLGFKLPLIERVEKISTRNQALVYKGVQAYSRDQQPAQMTVSISFHVPPSEAGAVYTSYNTIDALKERLIVRQLPTQLENVFGQYTAISAVQDRTRLVQDLQNAMRKAIVGPVTIDSVQIENIDFSDAYEKSIEDRMKAEVAIATRKQNLETEKIQAQIAVTQAQAQAESKLAAAKAEAETIRLRGAAEAEAIRLRGAALRDNPGLVNLTTAERWDGKLPETMIPGGTVPFISTK